MRIRIANVPMSGSRRSRSWGLASVEQWTAPPEFACKGATIDVVREPLPCPPWSTSVIVDRLVLHTNALAGQLPLGWDGCHPSPSDLGHQLDTHTSKQGPC